MTGDKDDGMMLSRRDAIRGGAALGTMALASRIGAYAQVVEAQITEPRIQLGSDYAIHDSGGDLVINHDPNGDILTYDATADEITTLKPLTSLTTKSLVIGGTLYGEDDNSPWTASAVSSDTYTVAGSYEEVIVMPFGAAVGFDQFRINGKSDTNYRIVDNSDTQTQGQNEWDFGAFVENHRLFSILLNENLNNLHLYVEPAAAGTGLTVGGRYVGGTETSIDSITGIASSGTRDFDAVVLGRDMSA